MRFDLRQIAVKEGDDLRAGAVVSGGKFAAAHAVRDALLHGPVHGRGIVFPRRHVKKKFFRKHPGEFWKK